MIAQEREKKTLLLLRTITQILKDTLVYAFQNILKISKGGTGTSTFSVLEEKLMKFSRLSWVLKNPKNQKVRRFFESSDSGHRHSCVVAKISAAYAGRHM